MSDFHRIPTNQTKITWDSITSRRGAGDLAKWSVLSMRSLSYMQCMYGGMAACTFHSVSPFETRDAGTVVIRPGRDTAS